MAEVNEAACSSEQALGRQFRWGAWFCDGIARNTVSAQDQLEAHGVSATSLMEVAGGRVDPEENRTCRQRRIRKNSRGLSLRF